MRRVSAGDETALGELMDRYWVSLVKFSLGFIGDMDTAEDLVQEAFVRVWRSRSSWKPTGSVRAFLYRIVRNLALQENEKRGVRRGFGRWSPSPPAPPTPAEELERKQLRLSLNEAVESLSSRRREVLTLARFHDLTYNQIAEVMGISAQTVANQMSSALRELRRKLKSQRP